jgi:hypothetical protein
MTNPDRDVLEALASLDTHPGWRLFVAHVAREWGPNGQRYQTALDQALDLADDAAAASHARQVRAGRKTIELLMRWPAEEVARLTREARGTGPAEDASPSRRGGL